MTTWMLTWPQGPGLQDKAINHLAWPLRAEVCSVLCLPPPRVSEEPTRLREGGKGSTIPAELQQGTVGWKMVEPLPLFRPE